MKSQALPIKNVWGIILLTILAFLGNYFHVELFLGFHFVFGSIFTFIMIYYYGKKLAVAAAAISGIYTTFLWDNPYGFFLIVFEAWFIGHRYYVKKQNMLVSGILFLLLIAMPLSFLSSTVVLQFDYVEAALIMLKTGVNMLFNLIVANSAVFLIESFRKTTPRMQVSLQELLFNVFLLFFLMPLVFFLVYVGNKEFESVKAQIEKQLDDTEREIADRMNSFYHRYTTPLVNIADKTAIEGENTAEFVQQQVKITYQSFPFFKIIYISNENGQVMMKQARYALRHYPIEAVHSSVNKQRFTYLSNVFSNEAFPEKSFVALNVPVERQSLIKGYVVGYVNPVSFLPVIQNAGKGKATITFIDQQDYVIISNDPAQKIMTPFIGTYDDHRSGLMGKEKKVAGLKQWTSLSCSRTVQVSSEIPWKAYIKIPINDYKHDLYEKYIRLLCVTFFFLIAALILSSLLSRWIQASLTQVAGLTTNLPDKIQQDDSIQWPNAMIKEVTNIINNFKETENKLRNMFSQIMEAQKHLTYLAHYDPLTNVHNRAYLLSVFEKLTADRSKHINMAVFFIDLDRFKIINDTLGHAAGDTLLIEAAKRLKSICKETAIISRLGGDEFIILTPPLNDAAEAEKLAHQIISSLSIPYGLNGGEYYLTASLGISLYPDDGEDMGTLIKNADMAMYSAKDKGKNTFHFYDTAIQQHMLTKVEMENELRHAVERGELHLYYQPQIDLRTGRIIGLEALIRWFHPTLGFVSPSDFIPLAEETGLIIDIGDWVLHTACHDAQSWHENGWDSLSISVNVSMKQLLHNSLLHSITSALETSGLDAHFLKVEITESAAMSQPDLIKEKLYALKRLGIELALDDFGTGYSSFHYLKSLPVDVLKIDRSFVEDIEHNADDTAIVKALIEVGHSLRMIVVAEGVKNEQQQHILQRIQCDQLQGFLFSKPLPREELQLLLEKNLRSASN